MGCARICSGHRLFVLINIAFAMYAGALLATAARLAWDPSTYSWFRFLCSTQYRVSAAYVLAAGLWLAALAALGAAGAARAGAGRRVAVYRAGIAALALSELAYGAWMAASLARWWRVAPQAELARKGIDLLHDLKPALLAVERYRDLARPLYDMIEEVEREAPNNAFVIVAFGLLGALLQVAAFVLASRLPPPAPAAAAPLEPPLSPCKRCACAADIDSDASEASEPNWRKNANLRMYTILDKIF